MISWLHRRNNLVTADRKVAERFMPPKSKRAQLVDDLREKSKRYAKKATLLSNLLEQAESFLCEMPGKAEIHVRSPQEDYTLSFCKTNQGWRLYLHRRDSRDDNCLVTEANIRRKAEAAQLLPALYTELQSHIGELQEVVDKGLESLMTLTFLDFQQAETADDHYPDRFIEEEDPNAIPF